MAEHYLQKPLSSIPQTIDPTPLDSGYNVGAVWFNSSTGDWFICCDATLDNAVWVKLISEANIAGYLSANSSLAEMRISSSANTTSITLNTFKKASGTTVGDDLVAFTHSTNRLTYTGTTTKTFQVTVDGVISNLAALLGATLAIGLSKNGSSTMESSMDIVVSALADGNFGFNCLVSLATNDYIEIWVTSRTSGVNSCLLKALTVTVQ